jgi:hypothetical protein
MSIDSVSGGVAASTLQPLSVAASLDKQSQGTLAASNQALPNQVAQSQVAADSNDNKVTPVKKPSTDSSSNESHKQPARTMSHVIQTYNQHGKVRVKYVDSHNNVIYQTPPEMVAKTQDLMTTTQSANNIKG